MKKLILILIAIFFTTAAYSHSTKSFKMDSKKECHKRKSMLNWVSKNQYYKGGELIKFQSYTGFDQRTVIIGGHKKNPIEITSYLQLPKGNKKVPIVFLDVHDVDLHCITSYILLHLITLYYNMLMTLRCILLHFFHLITFYYI